MHTCRTLGILLLLVAASSPLHAEDAPPRTLRVLSYNIHHGRGNDGRVDLARIALVIRSAQPDLVALQEVDESVRRSGQVAQTAELARLTGLHGKFARQIDYDGGQYGQAILSKWPLGELDLHMLPGDPPREQRLLARASIQANGHTFWFATTHLHHADQAIREAQVAALNRLFSTSEPPVIVAGDFNATPESAAMGKVARAWQIAGAGQNLATFPAAEPSRQLDYVVFRPGQRWRVTSVEVIAEPVASDHAPLLVVLETVR